MGSIEFLHRTGAERLPIRWSPGVARGGADGSQELLAHFTTHCPSPPPYAITGRPLAPTASDGEAGFPALVTAETMVSPVQPAALHDATPRYESMVAPDVTNR